MRTSLTSTFDGLRTLLEKKDVTCKEINDYLNSKNYYELFDVAENDSNFLENLKRSRQKLVIALHPDKLVNHSIAEDAKNTKDDFFKKIDNAYQLLSNERSRRAYNLLLNPLVTRATTEREESGTEEERQHSPRSARRRTHSDLFNTPFTDFDGTFMGEKSSDEQSEDNDQASSEPLIVVFFCDSGSDKNSDDRRKNIFRCYFNKKEFGHSLDVAAKTFSDKPLEATFRFHWGLIDGNKSWFYFSNKRIKLSADEIKELAAQYFKKYPENNVESDSRSFCSCFY